VSVFIIAEAGVNHNGDGARALKMVDVAAAAGADAIKFQTFTAEKLVSLNAPKAEYQKHETGDGNQFAMLKALEMSAALHHQLIARCAERDIEFMSTPFDLDAAEFLVGAGMQRLKIPSGELINHPFLRAIARFGRPMILSTGMGTMAEIHEAVAVIDAARRAAGIEQPLCDDLTILHCTSNYPAELVEVNLRAMATIAAETSLPVGYSDHTLGTTVSVAAVAMGATVIEKHFTLDRELPGPDHRASLMPEQLADMVAQIRAVETALGSAVKAPSANEVAVSKVARRSITAIRDIASGDIVEEHAIALLRPADGIAPKYWDAVVGRRTLRPITAGQPISWSDLEA
jgi:N,N'-diacetyllegionaminate synthase